MAYSGYEKRYRVATSLQRPRITRIRCIHLYRWKADVLGLSGARHIIPDIYNRRDTYCIYSQYSKKKNQNQKRKRELKKSGLLWRKSKRRGGDVGSGQKNKNKPPSFFMYINGGRPQFTALIVAMAV